MLFIKIDNLGIKTNIYNQISNDYINYFYGEFTFIIFADKKNDFLNVLDYANYIFRNHNVQRWLKPDCIKYCNENVIINDLKKITNDCIPLHVNLITNELNTSFPIDKIINLYPSDDNFTNCNLYQVVDDCNYKSFILETDKYWYLIGYASS